MRVLLLEDEPEMAALVAADVSASGFVVDKVATLEEAEAAISLARYGLVLMDRRLPDGDSLNFVRQIKARQPGVAVIMLTALDSVSDRVDGLDAGADDYLVKPFESAELRARIRAALRRPGGGLAPVVRCGALAFDPNSREVTVEDVPVLLNRRELALLACLIRRVGRVVQREQILNEVYGFDEPVQPNTIEAHVSRLRTRLTRFGAGVLIHPVRGVGYMLDAA